MSVTTKNVSALSLGLVVFALSQGTASAGWFENATGVRTPEPIRKIAPNGISIRVPREQTSTFGIDPQQVATVFHITNKAGGSGWFQLSILDPQRGWRNFTQKKFAKHGATISWRASVANISNVKVVAYSPSTGKQVLTWQNMRYRYKNESHNDAAKSYTQHRYYTLGK